MSSTGMFFIRLAAEADRVSRYGSPHPSPRDQDDGALNRQLNSRLFCCLEIQSSLIIDISRRPSGATVRQIVSPRVQTCATEASSRG